MFDPILLKTFLTVTELGSFTAAAANLGLGQPTVSQHIKRLETEAGRKLLERDTHSVALTAEGDAMVGFAQAIIDANERARRYLIGSNLSGKLRFGASEDFVSSRLPAILSDFADRHPSVEIELTVALSGTLFEALNKGELDLILAKRRLGPAQKSNRPGKLVYAERLVWAARDRTVANFDAALPLIMFPRPSITRAVAVEALDRCGIAWRTACTCGSLSGLRAAASAGLGIMVQPRSMVPADLMILPTDVHLPELEEVEFVLTSPAGEMTGTAAELANEIIDRHARQGLGERALAGSRR